MLESKTLSRLVNDESLSSIERFWIKKLHDGRFAGKPWRHEVLKEEIYREYCDFCVIHALKSKDKDEAMRTLSARFVPGMSKKTLYEAEGNEIVFLPGLKACRQAARQWLPDYVNFETTNKKKKRDGGDAGPTMILSLLLAIGTVAYIIFSILIWLIMAAGIIGILVFGIRQISLLVT